MGLDGSGRSNVVEVAKAHARSMSNNSRREEIPIRSRFIRDVGSENGGVANTALKRVVETGGRDGIALRLYLALVWRASAEPYTSDIAASKWGELLALDLPETTYARRVNRAIGCLEAANLIKVDRCRGKTSVITLLDESGNGRKYVRPRTGKTPETRWIKIPVRLWQEDAFYDLKTPGLAMLLAILAEKQSDDPVWWSVNKFQERIGISQSTRSRGVKELKTAGWVHVQRKPVTNQKGTFAKDHYRNTYDLRLPK